MTNTQFYIGTAIPSILIILGWLHQNVRFTEFRSDVDRRFDGVDRQFDRMDRRLTLIVGDQKQFFTMTDKLDGRIASSRHVTSAWPRQRGLCCVWKTKR